MGAFQVKVGTFEGPLDLLLELVERRKLHISDVSLAAVTDEYIAHVKALGTLPLADTAHFILIAATLLLIKSKSLLPALLLTEEETASIEELERRLTIYKKMRELSGGIRALFGTNPSFLPHPRPLSPLFSPGLSLSARSLYEAMSAIIRSFPVGETLARAVVAKVVSLEEMMERLAARMQKALHLSFKEFANADTAEKVEVIVGFLALLELVRRGALSVRQDKHFADISIETAEVVLPRYGS